MKANRNIGNAFLARLGRFSSVWKRGRAIALLGKTMRVALATTTLYFVADYFLALSETARYGLNLLLPLAWLATALPEARRIFRSGPSETARRADRIGGHRRNEILTAWELLRSRLSHTDIDSSETTLPDFLLRRSVNEALVKAEALPLRRLRPMDLIARQGRLLIIQVLVAVAVVSLLGLAACATIAPRLLWPGRDIPPYSRYTFEVVPQTPTIVYGGSAELSVVIDGAPVNDQVWLLTRQRNRALQRAACFQDGGGRYAQRLENVTQPLEFCFAVGRARSRWQAIDLQLQPQVLQARVRLTPPAYTDLPAVEFPAGQADVAGVRGTRIALSLTSNRPLREGTLTLRRRRSGVVDEQVIGARLTSDRTAVFDWVLEEDGEARATLRDLRGTPTAEPVVLPQRRLPDELPRVSLIEPPEFSLATTSAVLAVSGRVDDDFGITRIDWIRGMVGFHDRGVTLRHGLIGRQLELAMPLDLGALGVQPEQTIEFYVEALDNNPHLAGIAASGLVRVKIVSDEEYAEIRRNQESVDNFIARYRDAEAAMAAVLASLDDLNRAVSSGVARAEVETAVNQAASAHAAAEQVYQMLARDFALYDVELDLSAASERIVSQLAENQSGLAAMLREPASCTTGAVDALIARLAADAASVADQTQTAERLARIARVMDGAARFQAIVRRQADLVRRLTQRYDGALAAADTLFLAGYGEEQALIERELAAFADEAAAAANDLPAEMEALQRDTLLFLQALEETGASNHMGRAVIASRNSDARQTCREAQLALEKLQSLLQANETEGECKNSFANLCRGCKPDFGSGNASSTLQAMFRALCRRRGVGTGSGPGVGSGEGGAGPGGGTSGYSELAMPVYGPPRGRAGGAGDGRGEAGTGAGRGGVAGRSPAVIERLRSGSAYDPAGEAVPIERLPLRYREAVKRYFRDGTEGSKE